MEIDDHKTRNKIAILLSDPKIRILGAVLATPMNTIGIVANGEAKWYREEVFDRLMSNGDIAIPGLEIVCDD